MEIPIFFEIDKLRAEILSKDLELEKCYKEAERHETELFAAFMKGAFLMVVLFAVGGVIAYLCGWIGGEICAHYIQ